MSNKLEQFKQSLGIKSFPMPFIRALLNDEYTKGDSEFSVTGLLQPPQRTFLALDHEKVENQYSSFMALLGTTLHAILEKHSDESDGEIAEKRLFAQLFGSRVSGQLDLYEKNVKTLYDYKLVAGVQDKAKHEHYLQVNMNGYLATLNGYEVQNVGICYIQRDWSYLRSTLDPGYPKFPWKIFVHPYEEVIAKEAFQRTIKDHQQAVTGKHRDCTVDEKWQKPDTYALKKMGAKKARKLCDSYAEAEENKKPGEFIEIRKGERTYCKMYCGYSDYCSQFKRESPEISEE